MIKDRLIEYCDGKEAKTDLKNELENILLSFITDSEEQILNHMYNIIRFNINELFNPMNKFQQSFKMDDIQ